MNPGDLPENLGRPMPKPDRLTVEDHIFLAAITGLLAGPAGVPLLAAAPRGEVLVNTAANVAASAMSARADRRAHPDPAEG